MNRLYPLGYWWRKRAAKALLLRRRCEAETRAMYDRLREQTQNIVKYAVITPEGQMLLFQNQADAANAKAQIEARTVYKAQIEAPISYTMLGPESPPKIYLQSPVTIRT